MGKEADKQNIDEGLKFPVCGSGFTQAEEILWARYINNWGPMKATAQRAAEELKPQLRALESCSIPFAEFFDFWDCPEDSPFEEADDG